MENRLNRLSLFVLLSAFAGVGILLVLTHWGVGLFDLDSFSYLSSAHNLATGHGLSYPVSPTNDRPLLNFAPLLPILLAGLELLGLPSQVAVRWLNVALYAANLCLFAVVIYQSTKSLRFSAVSVFVFLMSAELMVAHAWALSEPLLIFLMLGSLVAFLRWHWTGAKGWFWALCICIALAVSTKFVALALFPPYIVMALLEERSSRARWSAIGWISAAALLPFLIVSARSYLLSASFHGFSFGFVPLRLGNLSSALRTLSTWFFPEAGYDKFPLVYALLFFSLLTIVVVFLAVRLKRGLNRETIVPLFGALLFPAYMALVILAKMAFDHGIGFQDRMLVPLFPFLLASGLVVLYYLSRLRISWIKPLYVAFVLCLGVYSVVNSLSSWSSVYNRGLGWNRREVVQSKTLAELSALAADPQLAFFSNNPYSMYFLTGNVGYRLEGFPPEGDQPSYLVLFKLQATDEHTLPERYVDILTLVSEDSVAAIYRILTD